MKKIKSVFGVIVLGGLLCIFIVFMYKYSNCYLNADDSSELILANLLSSEKSVLSKNWYYSTEIKLLNTQLVFAPLFLIFKNWHSVRVIGAVEVLMIMLISAYFLGKQLELKKANLLIFLCCLMLPFSGEYLVFVLTRSYYVPYIVISFVTLAILLKTVNEDDKKKYVLLTIINGNLALVAGLGGLRQILVLYIPLFFAGLFLLYHDDLIFENAEANKFENGGKNSKLFIQSLLLNIFAGVGYILNIKVLRHFYSFSSFNEIKFTGFNIDNFFSVFNGFLYSLGYRDDVKVFSGALIQNVTCFVVWFFAIYSMVDVFKSKNITWIDRFITVFFTAEIFIFWGLYTFTDFGHTARYNLPIIVFVIPVVLCLFQRRIDVVGNTMFRRMGVLLVFAILCSGLMNYNRPEYKTHNELEDIAAILIDGQYDYGYATYWNTNVLTELSDGVIEMHGWKPDAYSIQDVNEPHRWLQLKKHDYETPRGKVFVLFDSSEKDSFIAQQVSGGDVIYSSDNYIVFGFDSYNDLMASTKND